MRGQSMRQKAAKIYVSILRWGISAILIIAPFYVALSIWAASHLHHLDLFKSWKEIALLVLVAIILGFLITHGRVATKLFRQPIVMIMAIYALLIIAIGGYDLLSQTVSDQAVIYGWLVDLRIVGIFLVALITFYISQERAFAWKKILLIPATAVILFGFLQATVLPADVLNHFGYSTSSTKPFETVDNQPNIVRIQSTLRGPNPFGAYLLIVCVFILAELLKGIKGKYKYFLWVLLLISLFDMYNTYSRSAEIGLFLAFVVLLFTYKRQVLLRYKWGLLSGIIIACLAVGTAAAKHNYLAQNIVFHSSNRSTSSLSSNSERLKAVETASKDVVHHPLGGGVGSAGPASRRNNKGSAKIAENYYLQLGQEIGIAGMALFIVFNVMLAAALWARRADHMSATLLACFVGLSFANLLYHAWADDTLAYIWWGLAGIALAPAILTDEHKRHGKKQKTAQ